jgi:hypothetical protein
VSRRTIERSAALASSALTGAGLRLSAGSDPMKVSQGDVSIVLEPKTNPLFIGIHHSIIE